MLPAVHTAQVVLTLVAGRMVVRKLRQLHGLEFQHELRDAANDALEGGGDVGAFVHTAYLDACHRVVAGVRVIRGFATMAAALGLLGAMTHHFWLLHADHGPSLLALAAAEKSANAGALVSMGLGLGTALVLIVTSRFIRSRVVTRLAEIARFAEQLEADAARREQWTGPPGE